MLNHDSSKALPPLDYFLRSNGRVQSTRLLQYNITKEELYKIFIDPTPNIDLCYCGNTKKLIDFKSGFRQYCSNSCMSRSPEINEKRKKTTLKNYGYESHNQVPSIKEKKVGSYIEKYGVTNPSKAKEIKDVKKKTSLVNYGVENITLSHLINMENFNEEFILTNFIEDGFFDSDKCCGYFNCTINIFKGKNFNLPPRKVRYFQKEIFELHPFKLNDRTAIYPLEIDYLSTEHKFGIEYNGAMFHSYGKSPHTMFNNFDEENPNKHANKTKLCEEMGIQLYQIFENEWIDPVKRDIWKSVINNKLRKSTTVYARKCTLKEVPTKDAMRFLQHNHLQGGAGATVKVGLYFEDELVSLMTFGKSRFSKRYQWELIRFCNKLNVSVVGSASKLLKYFEQTYLPDSIVSYANRRWSQGNLYEKLGFEFSHLSAPNYFYFNDRLILESRNKYQKHKLLGIIDNFDETLTETENMYNNGYRKIYDCGNLVFFKTYT